METQYSKSKCEEADNLNIVKTLLDEYEQGGFASLFDEKCINCMCCRDSDQIIFKCSGCKLVTYCDRECQRQDWSNHRYVCKEFPVVNDRNVFYTTGLWGKHLAGIRERGARLLPRIPNADYALEIFKNLSVCHYCWETWTENMTYCKCTSVSYCSETCANADIVHKEKCERFRQILRLSYPLSIFNALHEVSTSLYRVNECTIYDMEILTIHIIDSNPIFDARAWEEFMSTFPKLKKLNIVFVMQHEWFDAWFSLNYPHEIVNTCDISYSVQKMEYHMFFASMEYTEPDVVVVFGNRVQLGLDFDYENFDDIVCEMSYRNMMYSPRTILILMDKTEELVRKGVKIMNEVQPLVQIMPPRVNSIKEAVLNEDPDIDYGCEYLNEKQYFLCLRRN